MSDSVSPHKRFPWKDNWNAWSYLTQPVKDRFYEWLCGGRSLKVVVAAGPQTFLRICQAACDWDEQFKAGYPLPLKLVAAFCEPIFTEEGAFSVNALSRLHKYLQPRQNVLAGIWDPNAPAVMALRHQIETGYRKLREKHKRVLNLPEISYLSPKSKEAEQFVQEVARERTSKGRRAFDILLSGPNGAWIPWWARKTTGEVSIPNGIITPSGAHKRDLATAVLPNFANHQKLAHGFCWGFHPVGSEGDEFGYCAYRGKDAIAEMVGHRLDSGRVALMGLGPTEMDDPRLLDVTGPLTKIGVEYPPRMKPDEEFEQCRLTAEWYARQVRPVMFGEGNLNYPHLGHAIAKRILILDAARNAATEECRRD